jgi:protein-disulfide isomerase
MSTEKRNQSRTERAAAIRNEQARQERTKRILITVGIVAVLAVIVAAGVWFSNGSSPATATSKTPKAAVSGHTLVVGNNPNAKTKVVVYEDFLCPFCREFETTSRDFLRADAAEGKVLVEYRPFQLLQDDYSKRALNAWGAVLQKGTPAQALEFHDLLYDNQPYENAANKPDNAQLQALAKKAGVKQSVLDSFDTFDSAFYAAAQASAQKAHVTGTPTVLVNGKQLGGASVDDMAKSLEKQIAGS